jgi:DNA-binding response OmpR family regulator
MPKVLLAEDDTTMVSLLKTLLRMEGFEVASVFADDDIPTAIRSEVPDVLLLDVHLSRQDGLEILRGIRSDPQIRGLRVVMTSGLNLRDACIREGATDFLMKPFMPDELVGMLRRVIGVR